MDSNYFLRDKPRRLEDMDHLSFNDLVDGHAPC